MMTSLAGLRRFLVALAVLACAAPAHAVSNSSATAPAPKEAAQPQAFRMAPEAMPLRSKVGLGAVEAAAVEALKKANSDSQSKRLQIGIGRQVSNDPAALSAALKWTAVPGGMLAHWEVTSAGARALRIGLAVRSMSAGVEIRFGSRSGGPVYGPFSASEVTGVPTYWSPVLEGEAATVEIFVPDGVALPVMAITQLSHLLASPTDPNAATDLKNGASGSCQVDLVCRSPSDAALAAVGKSVARMTFVDGASTFTCTGTLLNPIGGVLTPYFYSASHCLSTQAVASTLTTHWFYDRAACGSGDTAPGLVQLTGGATLLHADRSSDALLLRLNQNPPAGAVYAGWDATTLGAGTALTAVHHPRGDWKKVSLGSMGAFQSLAVAPPAPSASFIRVDWTSGVTEGGSSGSGIFTPAGTAPFDYRLRGGLYGGPSSCASPTHDFYSRLDQVYPSIRQYLDPAGVNALNVIRSGTGSGLVASSPSGISCGGTCSAAFDTGASVTLTATASVGSTFTGWSGGGCSGTTPTCTVTMSAAQTVTAGFALVPGVSSLASALDSDELSFTGAGNALWTVQSQQFFTGGSAARSGTITHSQVSTISTTVNGPGTLSFRWSVSSEANFDFLTFFIGGVAQAGRISGEVGWTEQVFNIPAGPQTLEWRYSKDGSVNAGLDAGFLDNVRFVSSAPVVLTVNKAGTGSGVVTSIPARINCGSTCAGSFTPGTQVTLTAVPAAGSTFQSWAGGCASTSPTCTTTMTSDRVVIAFFTTNAPGSQNLRDFNADGKTDLLWQNTSTGDRYVWLMDGSVFSGATSLGVVSTVWSIAATGDFNADGQADLLWQNTVTGDRFIWIMNNGAYSSGISLGIVPLVWSIAGTGDFNGDGQTDILWQNTFTGDRYIWFMNGASFSGGASLGVVPTVWSIAGTGDMNGDGKPDILWQNAVTGDRFVWFMNGASYSGGVSLGVLTTDWSIAGTGDFNGDGKADIVWQNTVTGDRYVWFMNGASFSGAAFLGTVPPEWRLVP